MAISTKTGDATDLPPKTRQLHDLGRQAFGNAWQYRLAQYKDVNLKTVNRWATGERAVPDDLLNHLGHLAAEYKFYGLDRMLETLEAMDEKSINLHVLAGHLADWAARFKPPKPVPRDKIYRNKRKPKPETPPVENMTTTVYPTLKKPVTQS
jgi:hypothetical protein